MSIENNFVELFFNSPYSAFYKLSSEEKDRILSSIEYVNYKKNEMIFVEGGSPEKLYCLIKGKTKIFSTGAGGRNQIIVLSRPGCLVGYRGLFAEGEYNASGVAVEDSCLGAITKDFLFEIMKNNSEFTMGLLKSVSRELGISNTRTISLTQKHIRGRLAESLLFLIQTYNYYEDGVTIGVLLSREEIASLSNMTTSNAIRTLSSFASEDVISLEGRKIKVLDYDRLEKISNMG